MNKKITLGPTLVVLIGPSCAGKSTFAQQFSPYEVVSADALRVELYGDVRRQDGNDVVMDEFDRRICNRLELGRRVVADATHIRNTTRRRTARLAAAYGARVVYVVFNRPLIAKLRHPGWRATVEIEGKDLISRDEEVFAANERKILAGDSIADVVIDNRKEVPQVVMPLARDCDVPARNFPVEQAPLMDIVSRGYKGILYVGDIHGNLEGMNKMAALARSEHLFMFFMGDIVDYAPDTLKTADRAAYIVFNGEGAGVLGNHERKILKYIRDVRRKGVYEGTLSPGNDVTINQLKAMDSADRFEWETRFFGLCDLLPHFVRMPRYFFVHGAANESMLNRTEFRFNPKTPEESLAMFGEGTGEFINGFPERKYDWINEIPPRQTVVVGHDCRSPWYPYVTTGTAGGRAIFLDTGSSKPERYEDGRLSAMRLDIEWNKRSGFTLENERFFSDRDL